MTYMDRILDDTGVNSLLEAATGLEHQADRLEKQASTLRSHASLIRVVVDRTEVAQR